MAIPTFENVDLQAPKITDQILRWKRKMIADLESLLKEGYINEQTSISEFLFNLKSEVKDAETK